MKLLKPEHKPLQCSLCGPYPKWLGFNGVSLGMNKDNINWDSIEKVHSTAEVPLGATVLKQKDHLLLPEASTRALLQ